MHPRFAKRQMRCTCGARWTQIDFKPECLIHVPAARWAEGSTEAP